MSSLKIVSFVSNDALYGLRQEGLTKRALTSLMGKFGLDLKVIRRSWKWSSVLSTSTTALICIYISILVVKSKMAIERHGKMMSSHLGYKYVALDSLVQNLGSICFTSYQMIHCRPKSRHIPCSCPFRQHHALQLLARDFPFPRSLFCWQQILQCRPKSKRLPLSLSCCQHKRQISDK